MPTCFKCGGSTENGELLCVACSPGQSRPGPQTNPGSNGGEKGYVLQSGDSGTGNPKKKRVRKILVSVLIVLIILVGVVSVGKIFYNRDFMQLIMGKSQYAQRVERDTANATVQQMISGLEQTVGNAKSFTKGRTMQSSYKLNLKLEDGFLRDMNLQKEDATAIQKAVGYLNGLKIESNTHTDGKGTDTMYAVTDSTSRISLHTLMYNDGKLYLHIPEVSDQYLSFGNQETARFNLADLAALKYDPVKLEGSLNNLVKIYLDSLNGAEMKTENNQSITIDGTTVQGQKLTASLNAEQTAAMVKAVAQAAQNDAYLYTFVSDNYGLIASITGNSEQAPAEKLTKEKYGKMIQDLISNLHLDQNKIAFSAVSYLSQDGSLLAHCYEGKGGDTDVQINTLNAKDKLAVDFIIDHKKGFTFSDTKTGAGTGKMQFRLKSTEEPQNIGLNIDYSGCKIAKFLGSDALVGKFVISLYDPDHEIQNFVGGNGLPASFSNLDQSSLTVETTVNGEESSGSSFQLSMPGVLSLSLTGSMSGAPGSSAIMTPPADSQVVDLSSEDSAEEMNEFSYNGLDYLSRTLHYDPELSDVLYGFGITKEQLDMLLAYNQG